MADRRFNIAEYGEGFNLDTNDYDGCDDPNWTLVPCPLMETCEACGKRPRHFDSIFVAVDGACRGNGTPYARAAIGVYFAEFSEYNVSVTIPGEATNQVAELKACLIALRQIIRIKEADNILIAGTYHPLSQVVIKSDSEYVVKGLTEWILKWRTHGFKNHKGVSVKNAGLFKTVDASVNELEDLGVGVRFWHVFRDCNKEADRLANAAFDTGSM
ncbi:hypothetical protein MMC18_000626 [Xylographa bjoerkii]|nr:hypothetical protein [Xylographa bjoerkii]